MIFDKIEIIILLKDWYIKKYFPFLISSVVIKIIALHCNIKTIYMNNKIFSALIFTCFILLLGCGNNPTSGGNAITLKFNLTKGSKYNYNIQMNMHVSESVMGNNVNVENKMGMGYTFEVINDSAGWKTLTSTISRISMDVNAGAQSIKFDTDSATTDTAGAAGMMSKIFGAMKGGQFSFTMNDKGRVGEVSGMKEMMQRMMGSINVPNAEMIMQSIGKSFDEANFKQNIEQSFGTYPDKPVKPGDTWTRTQTIISNGLPIKSENTYTLNSVTGDNANVKVSSKLSAGADSSAAGIKGMDGTTTGEMSYNIPLGVPTSGKLNMKLNMKVSAQGQEIPVNMDMKMIITGKKF